MATADAPALTESDRPAGLAFLSHPYHRGGVTRWMVDAASAFVSAGVPCWFVVPLPLSRFVSGGGRPTIAELLDQLPAARRPMRVTPAVGREFEFGTRGYRARVYARALQRGVPASVPVIASDDPDTWTGVSLLGKRNALIGVLHADEPFYYSLAERYRDSAAAIVAVSRRILERASAVLEGRRVVTDVIPCGIPLPKPPAHMENSSAQVRLIWVGRISERQKRVSDLIRIAAALTQTSTRFRLDIIGDGEDRELLHSGVMRAGLASHVEFHGWLPSARVLQLFRESDVMILPSNFEGMPIAAMEALANGCAVVASDTSGLEEYSHRPESGQALWIYPCGDVEAAVACIHRALAAPAARRAHAAHNLAEAEFGIDKCVTRYRRLLARAPSSAVAGKPIQGWHPADAVSHAVAFARRWKLAAARRVRDPVGLDRGPHNSSRVRLIPRDRFEPLVASLRAARY